MIRAKRAVLGSTPSSLTAARASYSPRSSISSVRKLELACSHDRAAAWTAVSGWTSENRLALAAALASEIRSWLNGSRVLATVRSPVTASRAGSAAWARARSA
jgi:hypothetical protein